MIPILYEKTETAFVSNGLARLRDCISCVVTEERNGIYECDFEYPVDGANYDLIQVGRIIGVTHDDTGEIQPFDIVSYTKPIDGVVTFHAVHISYRQSYMTVKGTSINSLADAFTLLGTATPSNPFTYWTDKTSSAYLGCMDGTPRSVRETLGGVEGSILDAYGGEYEWDKWTVKLWSARGQYRDFSIRYGVNMLDYNEEFDSTNTYSSCIPYWTDGTTTIVGDKQTNGGIPLSGREQCIPLDVSEKFESQPTKAQVNSMGASVMNSSNPTNPTQTIEVSFVRLQDMGEFADYQNLLQCKLCDTINVIFPDFNSSGQFKIVKTEWNALTNKYESMELGTLSMSLSEALGIGVESHTSYSGGGGGGTSDYNDLTNKPKINNVTLSGNKTLSDLGINIPTITDTYSGTSSDGMSGKAVKSAIDALDGTVSGSAGASKTLTAFSQTDGKVSATFGDISITKSQISDFPTIPTVNDATLTIQKNGTDVQTFTANASSDVTANITVPEDVSDLNNDSGFITSPDVVYCTCATAAGTAAKTTTIVSGSLSSLTTGCQAIVKFTNANTASSPTLKVGNTTATSIRRYGTTAPGTSAASSWNAGSCVLFIYDGTYWQMAGWINSTYSEISAANITNGTASTTGLITGRRAKSAVETFAPVKDVTVGGTSVLNGTTAEVPAIPSATSTSPKMDGTAAVGSETTWAKGDHVHPHDTSKQDTLVSGTNIKTINNNSLLGSGNISISGGGGITDYDQLDNRPQINSVTLTGNKSLSDLGIVTNIKDGTASDSLKGTTATSATGTGAVALGWLTESSGAASLAHGNSTEANGDYSVALGNDTSADRKSQLVIGEYNISDTSGADGTVKGDYAFIIGNGTGPNSKSNALTVDWNGNVNIPSGATYQVNGASISNPVVESHTDSVTVTASGTGSLSVDMTKSGYTCIGIVGIKPSGSGSSMSYIYGYFMNGTNAVVYFRNTTSTARTFDVEVTGLYLKN